MKSNTLKYLTILAILILSINYISANDNTSESLILIENSSIPLSREEYEAFGNIQSKYIDYPASVPVVIQNSLTRFLEKNLSLAYNFDDLHFSEDQTLRLPFIIAIRYADSPIEVYSKIVLTDNFSLDIRLESFNKIKAKSDVEALILIGNTLSKSVNYDSRYLAASAFLSAKNYTKISTSFLLDELTTSSRSRARALFQYNETNLRELYKNVNESDKTRIKEYIRSQNWALRNPLDANDLR